MSSMTHASPADNLSTLDAMDWRYASDRQAAERARLADLVGEVEPTPAELSAELLEVLQDLRGDSPALRFARRALADLAVGVRAYDATSYDQYLVRERIMARDYDERPCSRCRQLERELATARWLSR